MQELEPLLKIKWYNHFAKRFGSFLKMLNENLSHDQAILFQGGIHPWKMKVYMQRHK